MNLRKRLFYIFTVFVLAVIFIFPISAMSMQQTVNEIISDNEGRILCVSHRGDTALYPENSLEGVLSAREKGADMVSVCVQKTKDGVFVLCERESLGNVCDAPFDCVSELTFDETQQYSLFDNCGRLTEYRMASLENLIQSTDINLCLILDIDWADRDDIYELLGNEDALDRAYLRVKEDARKISGWVKEKNEKVNVIGIYSGNIIFNSISHVNTLSEAGMELVQYQSKNYFNVMYGSWTYSNFSSDGKARGIAPMYNPDLCGQRSDSENGWNELIKKGFTVIETNNTEALASYIEENTESKARLSELYEKAKGIETEKYSLTSKENLADAIEKAESVLNGRAKSTSENEQAYSELLFYLNEMKISSGEETVKGALNITAGKVVAAVLVGAAIFAAQVFVQKLHRKKRK